jgi:hypothetical protein
VVFVLRLEPDLRSTTAVWQIDALRHDPLVTKPAGVLRSGEAHHLAIEADRFDLELV